MEQAVDLAPERPPERAAAPHRGHRPGWALLGALALRDLPLAIHAVRGAALGCALARRHRGDAVQPAWFWGFLLRDVGALETPRAVLGKAGPLTAAEQDVVGAHPRRSAQLLEQVPALAPAAPIALHHHERWDGRGYPAALAGELIPLGARLAAVADTYSALTSPRPHRPARDPEDALGVLAAEAGGQLDPMLVAGFLDLAPALPPQLLLPPPPAAVEAAVPRLGEHVRRAQNLSRAQLEALFATALGLDAEEAACRFGRSPGTQRNWSSSLRRTLALPHRLPLPAFLTAVGQRVYEAVCDRAP